MRRVKITRTYIRPARPVRVTVRIRRVVRLRRR